MDQNSPVEVSELEQLKKQLALGELAKLELQIERDQANLGAMQATANLINVQAPQVQQALKQAMDRLEQLRAEFKAKYPEPPQVPTVH